MMHTKRPAYPGDEILKISEACAEAKCGQSTMYAWIAAGHIESVRIGGARRIWRSALYEALNNGETAE